FSGPAAKAASLYGWGSGFDGTLLFPRLQRLLALSGLPVIDNAAAVPRELDVVFLELVPTTNGPPGVVVKLRDAVVLGPQTLPLGQDLTLEVEAEFSPPVQTELTVLTDGSVSFAPPSPAPLNGNVGAKFTVERAAPPAPFVIFGVAGGSRLELQQV